MSNESLRPLLPLAWEELPAKLSYAERIKANREAQAQRRAKMDAHWKELWEAFAPDVTKGEQDG